MQVFPNTAFVLAAGLGQRMRPLTDHRPKPMVPLAGRPLIDHVLDRLALAGTARAVVNLHYQAAVLQQHLAQRLTPNIILSDERAQLLETGGGVVKALPLIGADPFVIHNSDTVWIEPPGISNLARLADAWDAARMDSVLLLARADASIGYDGRGDFHCGSDGRLSRRRGAETSTLVFAGVSIAHPRLFVDAPVGAFSLNVLWDRAIAAGRLYGIAMEGLWMHVGTPDALAEAEDRIAAAGGVT